MKSLCSIHRSWQPPTTRPLPHSRPRPALRTALSGLLAACGLLNAQAVTSAEADAIFEAHSKAFYAEAEGRAWFKESTDPATGKVSFWMRAEQLEMVLDVFERTKNPQHLETFTKLFHGFLADHGRTWERNEFNDDIMWMVIACVRAYLLSGKAETEFRDVAKENFDLCYARAISPDLGGGLWWKTNNQSKNACVNGPGAIAAFLLGKATGDAAYQAKAKELFLWEKATLFDAVTGKVSDNINIRGRIGRAAFTYNQGTFTGAANLLGYQDEAKLSATFTMNQLCRDGYLPGGNEKGDGGGFNGIAARWIARHMRDQKQEELFEPWLRKNADAAWTARRASDGLCWNRWPQPTPEGTRYSWGCSSAVVLMQVAATAATPAPAPAKPEEPVKTETSK